MSLLKYENVMRLDIKCAIISLVFFTLGME